MVKLVTYVLAIAVVGTGTVLVRRDRAMHAETADARLSSDAAYRDGVYLGSMARNDDAAPRPQVGRWSTDADRAMFLAGYRRGLRDRKAAK